MMNYTRLIRTLIRHEGLKTKLYLDTAGRWTIGVGRNLTDNGISEDEALILCKNDIERCTKEVTNLIQDFWLLDPVRQEAIINMLFNLGYPVFSQFKKFIAAVNAKDFTMASKEMLDSRWAEQVDQRAIELANMVRFGEINEEDIKKRG